MEHNLKQPMTRKELANAYGISPDALHDKLKREKLDIPKGLIYPKDLSLIFEKLGKPSNGGKISSNDNSNQKED